MKSIVSFFADKIIKIRSLKQQLLKSKKEIKDISADIAKETEKRKIEKIREDISKMGEK